MPHIKKILLSVIVSISLISLTVPNKTVYALSSSSIAFIILSQYECEAEIGDKIYLLALTSNGNLPTWKSSDSKVASVNTYGVITAKKGGKATITAKIKNAEASCDITVHKTVVTLSTTSASLERGETLKLSASTSNGATVTWKSSKKSIASINEYGTVTALKPGETVLTATADGYSATCKLKVKSPTIKLNKTTIQLYRGQTFKLSATVSSKVSPTWKTNKKSVAVVDETGTVTAQKHGTAVITATVDGVSKTCEVTVKKPDIILSSLELNLNKGASTTITATVSSGNLPEWSTSNPNIVTITSKGVIKAIQKGTAYVYASEDGTKVRCKIKVTE